MRILLLLRGAAGCGKSTWIEKNGLKPYAVSADDLRLLYQGPVMKPDGSWAVSHQAEPLVWKTLFRILRYRMQNGDFTVIDATHSKAQDMNRYKELCREYRYRIYCVDFTGIPAVEAKRRNAGREPFQRVPEAVIDTMYARFAAQKIPSGIKVISPDELETVWMPLLDFSCYKKIHHIGDIHGCSTALQKYLTDNGGIREDEMYIFTGDYIDRGIENAEVVNFLISVMDRKNVRMLEGSHERNLWLWAQGQACPSKEFELFTAPSLEDAGVDRKAVRQLYRKFGQCVYYRYGKDTFLVTHAGLSALPHNLSLVAARQMIYGTGDYCDCEKSDRAFLETAPDYCYQIHGHRNPRQSPVRVNDRVFNLEGQAEYGGCLRCVQVDADGFHCKEIKNSVFRTPQTTQKQMPDDSSIADFIIALRHNKYIQEKKFGNISSFQYTDQAFRNQAWNRQTVKARGLYIDTVNGRIVARAYEKFFNIGERQETRLDVLQQHMQFPVTAYVKENGFLGIVSYDAYADDLFVACKSTIDSRYAGWLKEMLYAEVSPQTRNEMKFYIKEKGVSFVFEYIDVKNDPHVIEYPHSRLVLLDIVYNKMDFKKYQYEDMCKIAERFGLAYKEKAYEAADWQEFFDWHEEVCRKDYDYRGQKIEGFVIEDSAGYMVKLKLAYYSFWKQMGSIAREVIKKGFSSCASMLDTPLANEFYGWVKKICDAGDAESIPEDVCGMRRMFYQKEGRS